MSSKPRPSEAAHFELVATRALEGAAMSLGTLLMAQRLRVELTQEDVGAAVGVSKAQVSVIERGRKHKLTEAQVDKLFDVLQIAASPSVSFYKQFLGWWRDNYTETIKTT